MEKEEKKMTVDERKKRGIFYRLLAVFLFLVAAMVLFVWIGGGCGIAKWGTYTLSVLDDGHFLVFLAIAVVSMIFLFLATFFLIRRTAGCGGGSFGSDGNILVEFAMLLPIILMFGLLMLQSSLLMGGYMTVHYASYCAARSAIVYVPIDYTRDPYEGDEERNVVFGVDPTGESMSDPGAGDKIRAIKDAAVWAVVPVSASDYQGDSGKASYLESGLQDMYNAYGKDEPNWVRNWLASKCGYAEDNTWVKLHPPTDIDSEIYGEHEDLHVTVRHNLYLSVPYAGAILATMDPDGVELGNGRYAIAVEVSCTLTNEGAVDQIDIEEFPD